MPRTKRSIAAAATQSTEPPNVLTATQEVMKIIKPIGNNLYASSPTSGEETLIEMPSRFRNTIWIKRGSYVLVDTAALANRDNKIHGEICAVVMNEKQWRKMPWWPSEFSKPAAAQADEDEDDITGKLPPTSSDSES